jgi:hypothetical protein
MRKLPHDYDAILERQSGLQIQPMEAEAVECDIAVHSVLRALSMIA